MANVQNEYYVNKVKTIRQDLPQARSDPLATLQQKMEGRTSIFSFSAVTPDTVDKIITNLKNSKASGIDELDTYILKLVKKEIVPAICHILNLSIRSNKFPTKWKIAKVIPLYKGKGSKFDSKNYRPVAILPILSKVLERAIFIQVVKYMDTNNYFNPNHHAYRSFHSTTTAMLQMYDTWLNILEQGDMAGVCMVDMSAAFDVVDTELLLEKLKLYGFDQNSHQWTWSYLTYRSQGVYIEGSLSKLLPLEAGVPQGSILGPLFYTIFTNELPQVIHEDDCPMRNVQETSLFSIQCQECGGLCCYADDSTYTVSGQDTEELSQKLSEKYAIMADFLTANKLKVNDDKTHILLMATRQKRKHLDTSSMSINTPTAIVKPSSTERLLGAQVHEDMRWKEHIMSNKDSLLKALTKRQGAIKKISRVASFKSRKMLANGVFMSKLIYLMPVWVGCEEYLANALQVVQNKVARSVTKKDIYTPTKVLMKECGWLNVRQLMVYHSLLQLHKIVQHQTPSYLFSRVSSQMGMLEAKKTYNYKTRQEAHGLMRQIPAGEARLDLAERSWCWRATKDYDTLPASIKEEKNQKKFKSKLKTWVLTKFGT